MLTKLQIRNFRCFDSHTLTFHPFTTVVGANNAGKSTVVEALRLLSLVVNRYGSVNFQDVPRWLELPKAHRGMSPSVSNIDWNTLSIYHNLGNPPAVIIATFDSNASVEIYIGPETEIHAVIKDAEGKPVITKGQTQLVKLPLISILPQVAPFAREENILQPEYAKRIISSSWASLHFRNQINLFPEYFDEFARLSESTWPGLKIRPLEGKGKLPGNKLALLLHDGDFVAEAAWMGHGLQMWLQAMWFLARSRQSDIVILDEPDVYLHADLQRKLVRILNGRNRQTIIATHSVEIMAEVDANDILIVNRKGRSSKFATTNPALQQVIDNLGGTHNLQLAKLSNAGRCLLVEGKDITFLRAIHNLLFQDSSERFDIIPNMPLGGWGGWNYAIGSQMLLSNAIGELIIVYCIFDSDYHTHDDIKSRYEDAAKKSVALHIWQKKEIENYFVIPEAVQRVITKRTKKISPPTIEQIYEVIDRIVEDQKFSVFNALSGEFHTQDKASGVTKANQKALERLDAAWLIRETRWGIVSGKTIISELSKWSHSKYGVSLSPMTIVKELRSNEIMHELSQVIRAIEKSKSFVEVGLKTIV